MHFFDAHRGDDEWVDWIEAQQLAHAVAKRLGNHGTCGAEGGISVRACFGKATEGDRLDERDVRSLVGCLVGHESAACHAIVCV